MNSPATPDADDASTGASEVEGLAKALGDIRLAGAREADWWESDEAHPLLVRVLRAECVPWAEGLLASDWLAAHTSAAATRAADDRAERIAQEVTALADEIGCKSPGMHTKCRCARLRALAARIARTTP